MSCNLCACATGPPYGPQGHCTGHGTCQASCTSEANATDATCTGAKCVCDEGYWGEMCYCRGKDPDDKLEYEIICLINFVRVLF